MKLILSITLYATLVSITYSQSFGPFGQIGFVAGGGGSTPVVACGAVGLDFTDSCGIILIPALLH